MKTDVSGRTGKCAAHHLTYNAEQGRCPLCEEERVPHRLAPPEDGGTSRFLCPFCGARSVYEGACSRYACRKRAGFCKPLYLVNTCTYCGGRTKYARSCTNYPCRQKAGTMSMYYRSVR
jgi:hypothetical protein